MQCFCKGVARWHNKKTVLQAFKGTASIASIKEGDVIHNYKVTRVRSVPQLFLDAVELQHLKTNSKHLHLAREDRNNVFNVLLRTTPMDSTGVAHILEHIVLCGSKKYPVRDPFFKMLDRSMATFMNAMTGSDYTMYPFATQNSVDFKNLLSVYLDAVFFPQITKSSFLQEGWRLENSDCNDQSSKIIFKGVVFNEMKGVMADQDYLFGSSMQRKLLPDHTYGNSSGGDPLVIPELTYKELKDFHATHYHPSNAAFFTYGNLDLFNHLRQIDEEVMQKFDHILPTTDVPAQSRWSSPRSAQITCCADELAYNPENQTSIALSYLLSDVSDSYETFVLSFLCTLLSDGPSSPFYKALIESGIGSSYAPATGFHSHQKECIFSIGLQGIQFCDVERVKDIILRTFISVVKEGFSDSRISGLLHQVELHQKHQTNQFGLHLSFNLMPLWQHGADAIDLLNIDKHIARLRKELDKDPELLQNYCRKYFENNLHNLTLTMTPDPDHNLERDAEESKLLHSRISKLNDKDVEQLFLQGKDLMRLQNKKEDLSCLPTLLVSDVPREQPHTAKVDLHSLGDVKVGMYNQPTNGVTYFTLMRTINNLPDTLKPFLPLFCSVLTQMGTLDNDYRQFSEMEELYTGGLHASVNASPSPTEKNMLESAIVLQSHCLDKNSEKMFGLWIELIKKPFFGNEERFRTLVRQNAQSLANSVPFSGHLFAMASASSRLSPSAKLTEMWDGLEQVKTMQAIANEENVEHILVKMQEIANYVLAAAIQPSESVRCSIHCMPDVRNKMDSVITGFLSGILDNRATQLQPLVQKTDIMNETDGSFQLTQLKRTLQELPLPVNFASMCLPTATTYTHPDFAALEILSRLLTTKFLLREVREKGGAYGAGARHGLDGVFQFFSYRDPRSIDTIRAFQQSILWACKGEFSVEDLNEAKLATFQKVDAPVAPCNQGKLYFTKGISNEMRKTHREQLLDSTHENIVHVAVKYLTSDNKNCVILGPKNEQVESSADWEVLQTRQTA